MSSEIVEKPVINRKEYLIPALTVFLLTLSCVIISSKKYFSNDELYSWFLLADKSFFHMLRAFGDKINNTPVLYFVLGWIWTRVWGDSELSLRLFSSLGISVAAITVWALLRRSYSFWASSIGVLAVFCTSEIILFQNAEARMYGLFIVLCAVALLLFDSANRRKQLSRGFLLSNAVIHAAMVHTHLFGLFYSGAVLFSLLVRDTYFRTWKPRLYLSVALSWLTLIFYIPAFLVQIDAGNPRSWIPIPVLEDLTEPLTLSSPDFLRSSAVVLLILISGFQLLFQRNVSQQRGVRSGGDPKLKTSLLIAAYSFLSIPIIVWGISRYVKPIFLYRYLIPSTLGWSILLAHLAELILVAPFADYEVLNDKRTPPDLLSTLKKTPRVLLIILLLAYPVRYAIQAAEPDLSGIDDIYGHTELPIVVQGSARFLEKLHYSRNPGRYFYVLDWESAMESGRFGPQEYKHLEALRRNYPDLFKGHIVRNDEFLAGHDRFLVLDFVPFNRQCPPIGDGGLKQNFLRIYCPQWVEKRILSNPDYQLETLGQTRYETVLLVESRK